MRSTESPNVEDIMYITEHRIKGSGKLLFAFLEKPLSRLCEVCLIRIKEQVSEKRNIVGTHMNTDCLVNNTFTKHNKNVVNHKVEHFNDISFRELPGRIGFF